MTEKTAYKVRLLIAVPNSFLLIQLSWYEPPHSFKHIAYNSGPQQAAYFFDSDWFWNRSLMTATVTLKVNTLRGSEAVWFWMEQGADFLQVGALCFSLAPRALHHHYIPSTIHANDP